MPEQVFSYKKTLAKHTLYRTQFNKYSFCWITLKVPTTRAQDCKVFHRQALSSLWKSCRGEASGLLICRVYFLLPGGTLAMSFYMVMCFVTFAKVKYFNLNQFRLPLLFSHPCHHTHSRTGWLKVATAFETLLRQSWVEDTFGLGLMGYVYVVHSCLCV